MQEFTEEADVQRFCPSTSLEVDYIASWAPAQKWTNYTQLILILFPTSTYN
jgi:hypothetical protein